MAELATTEAAPHTAFNYLYRACEGLKQTVKALKAGHKVEIDNYDGQIDVWIFRASCRSIGEMRAIFEPDGTARYRDMRAETNGGRIPRDKDYVRTDWQGAYNWLMNEFVRKEIVDLAHRLADANLCFRNTEALWDLSTRAPK